MATCLEVITRAFQKSGHLGLSANLDGRRAAQGLDVLKSFYAGLVQAGTLGRARTVYATDDYTAQEGDRVFKSDTLTVTIPGNYEITWLEETGYSVAPGDGGSEEDRAPRDASFVIVTDGTTSATSVYDAYSGDWAILENLALTDPAPFSRDKEALASALAFELSDDTQAQPGPSTMSGRRRFFHSISGLGSPERVIQHDYC